MHPQTGKTTIANINKVRLIDPAISWDQVRPHPKRVQYRPRPPEQIRAPRPEQLNAPTNMQINAPNPEQLPQDAMPEAPPPIPPLRLKRRHSDGEWTLDPGEQLTKRWRPDQVAVLEFVSGYFA